MCFRYVRAVLKSLEPGYGVKSSSGFILLENPVGDNVLTLSQLYEEVNIIISILQNTDHCSFYVPYIFY